MRLLLSSYSFGAGRGSEAGVGWNVARGLAERGHEVTVVTTGEFHHLNAPALAECGLPLRVLEWDCGITGFPKAASYRRWQRRVCKLLRELCRRERFDLVHHVTFNQYRDVHDVFCTGLPYVIGPVGGAETVAPRFWKELPWRMRLKEMLRYLPYDAAPFGARVRRHAACGVVLASTPQTQQRLQEHARLGEVRLMPIISIPEAEILAVPPPRDAGGYMMFDGGARPEKGAGLMLRALARLWEQGVHVPMHIAAVAEHDRAPLMAAAAAAGLPGGAVCCLPFMKRAELMERLRAARAFVSVGFRDAGCMALLEAVSLGVPSLCLDISGQHWLPGEYAAKLPLSTPDMESGLASAMRALLDGRPHEGAWHAERAAWLRREMSWEARISQLESIYLELLEKCSA